MKLVGGAGAALVAIPMGLLVLTDKMPGTIERTFQENSDLFPNPERGWHVSVDPDYDANKTGPALELSQLRSYREEGVTLVRKYYLLYDYRNSDIPQAYLDGQIVHDLSVVREAGVKLIPRFSYTWNLGFEPRGDEDAPFDRILSHLDQIRPPLQDNYDVISHMEMGFVGHYGEWHYATNDSEWHSPTNLLNVDNYFNQLNDNSRAIIDKVLDVLPQQRMVVMRYVRHLEQLYPNPLTEWQAYSGTDQARIGLGDDSVLFDELHRGSYNPDPATRQQERDYQEQVSRYTVMTGEPSGIDATRYLLKSDPFVELTKMHWRSLNNRSYEAVRDGVYDFWRARGAYEEIGRCLGYCFNLVDAQIQGRVRPGGAFKLSFGVENSGFAAPHNSRLLEVVLRHSATGEEYYVRAGNDPRRWWPGQSTRVEVDARVPARMRPGSYDVFLNLPDPEQRLYGRPEYSIRLANSGVWEGFSGYNSLGAAVKNYGEAVSGDPTLPVFSKRDNPPQHTGSEPIILSSTTTAKSEPAPAPELVEEENDTLVDFDDRPAGEVALTGEYGGIDWGSGTWYTAEDANGKYLYFNVDGNTSEATFTIPQGKVLKSLSLLKRHRSGTTNEILLRSGDNPDYAWTNPAPWWSEHILVESWTKAAPTITLKITSDAFLGAKNILIDNVVYGDASL